jgi:hypothetical protein
MAYDPTRVIDFREHALWIRGRDAVHGCRTQFHTTVSRNATLSLDNEACEAAVWLLWHTPTVCTMTVVAGLRQDQELRSTWHV